jgi:hypothetical protein
VISSGTSSSGNQQYNPEHWLSLILSGITSESLWKPLPGQSPEKFYFFNNPEKSPKSVWGMVWGTVK